MQRLILQGAKDFYVRQKAIDILMAQRVKPKDYLGEIRALFNWVQQQVRYTKDPFRVEVLHTARRMLELRAGDCDDMSILLAAMLESIGHPTRLVLVGPDPSRPTLFSHVYLEAWDRGRWIPLDPTMPYPMGWAPARLVKRVFALDRSTDMPSHNEVAGLSGPSPAPDWLSGLVRAVARDGIAPKNPAVKRLWDTLRHRRLLSASPWIRKLLRRMWQRGLVPRPRPQAAARMARQLIAWGLLPQQNPAGAGRAAAPFSAAQQGVLRPVAMQPVRPVQVRPLASAKPVATANLAVRPLNGLTASP
jgi:hypothetical protein